MPSIRFPNSIVWSRLPVISYIIPVIGHVGIGDEEGVIYDFSGDQCVAIDNFTFGPDPIKYFIVELDRVKARDWDRCIKIAAERYRRKRHSLCTNNCHHFVAECLNELKVDNRTNWTQFDVWKMITFHSKYTEKRGWLGHLGPFVLIMMVLTLLVTIPIVLTRNNIPDGYLPGRETFRLNHYPVE